MSPRGRPRVVFDCNVFLQSLANTGGPAGRAISFLWAGKIEVMVSRPILFELTNVLEYPSVRTKFPILNDDMAALFLSRLRQRATSVRRVPKVFFYPRAVQDEPYIDLALASKADYLVTRDNDLLALAADYSELGHTIRRRNHRLSIITPVVFLGAIGQLKD